MNLQEQLAICEKATPGPWVPYQPADDDGWWWVWQESTLPFYGGIADLSMRERAGSIAHACIKDSEAGAEQEKADATFIAAARTNYPLCLQKLLAIRELCEMTDDRYDAGTRNMAFRVLAIIEG